MSAFIKIYTKLFGKKVGVDENGNTYYESNFFLQSLEAKRWVIFNGKADPTKISPWWYNWIHHNSFFPPLVEQKKMPWYKKRTPNLTGTPFYYRPQNTTKKISREKNYQPWKPNSKNP